VGLLPHPSHPGTQCIGVGIVQNDAADATSPASGRANPASNANTVDLPPPLGATSATRSPGFTARSKSCNTAAASP
jgi:hypothetical protein